MARPTDTAGKLMTTDGSGMSESTEALGDGVAAAYSGVSAAPVEAAVMNGGDNAAVRRWRRPKLPVAQQALVFGVVAVLALGSVAGWLGFRANEAAHAAELEQLYLQVGRQGAVNLTSVDFETADADVQRILDSATGPFYEDFSTRSQAFVDVVKQTSSKTVGSVTEAGVEAATPTDASILVAVKVETSNAAEAVQEPRNWRMRVSVQKLGEQVMVSNVEFVP